MIDFCSAALNMGQWDAVLQLQPEKVKVLAYP